MVARWLSILLNKKSVCLIGTEHLTPDTTVSTICSNQITTQQLFTRPEHYQNPTIRLILITDESILQNLAPMGLIILQQRIIEILAIRHTKLKFRFELTQRFIIEL